MLFILKRKSISGRMKYFPINSDDVLYCADNHVNELNVSIGFDETMIIDMINKGIEFGNIEYSKIKCRLDGIFTDIKDYSINSRSVKYQPAVVVIDNNTECIQYIGCCTTEGKVYKIDIEFFNTLVHKGLVVDFPKRLSDEVIRLQLMTSYPVVKRELGLGVSIIGKHNDITTVLIKYINRDNNVVEGMQQLSIGNTTSLKECIRVPDYSTDFNKILEKL